MTGFSEAQAGLSGATWVRASARLTAEFAILFGALVAIAWLAPGFWRGAVGSGLNPLAVPVLLLAVQYGTSAGIVAAIVAAATGYGLGIDQGLGAEDYYARFLRFWCGPIAWLAAAVVIGGMVDRRLRERDELQQRLDGAEAKCRSITAHCVELRGYSQRLETTIAANGNYSAAEAMAALAALGASKGRDVEAALSRALAILVAADTSHALLLRCDKGLVWGQLKCEGVNARLGAGPRVGGLSPEHYQALVVQRRSLSCERADDARLLGRLGIAAQPIVGRDQRVMGALLIEQSGRPVDRAAEAALKAVCAELSQALEQGEAAQLPRVEGPRTTLQVVSQTACGQGL